MPGVPAFEPLWDRLTPSEMADAMVNAALEILPPIRIPDSMLAVIPPGQDGEDRLLGELESHAKLLTGIMQISFHAAAIAARADHAFAAGRPSRESGLSAARGVLDRRN